MMGILGYGASVGWGSRAESPNELAARVIDLISKVRAIGPVFAKWYAVPYRPLELKVALIAEQIAARVAKDEMGEVEPKGGYSWIAYSFGEPKWTSRGFSLGLRAGSYGSWATNSARFCTADAIDADLSLITYSTFKNVLLTLADIFDANVGGAFSTRLSDLWTRGRDSPRIDLRWMTYFGPRFAHLVTPPPTAIIERRANGGLFMAATNERFSTDNPAHMAVARDIQAAAAPFNALPKPYPGLEGP